MEGCKLCEAEDGGRGDTRRILFGKTSPQAVARRYEVTESEVMEHVNNHHVEHPTIVEEREIVSEQVNVLDRMQAMFKKLDAWSSLIIMEGEGELDRNKLDMAVKLNAEVRKTLETIAQLQGKLGKGDTYIYVQNMENKVNLMTNIILEEACPVCRAKIIRAIQSSSLTTVETSCNTP